MRSKIVIMKSTNTGVGLIGVDNLTEVYANTIAGDLVIVYPGYYDIGANSIQLKDGVNWNFLPGVEITSSSSNGTFYDNGVSVSCSISGQPSILNTGTGSPINLTGTGSTFYYSGMIPLTYSELKSMYDDSNLIAGQKYLITDYQTVHTIWDTSPTETHTGETEPLVVEAISSSKFSPIAFSPLYPKHILHYSIENLSLIAGSTKGTIYRRIDTESNVDMPFDYLNVVMRRYAIDWLGSSHATGNAAFPQHLIVRKTGTNELYLKLVPETGAFTSPLIWAKLPVEVGDILSPSKTEWEINPVLPLGFVANPAVYLDYKFFTKQKNSTVVSTSVRNVKMNHRDTVGNIVNNMSTIFAASVDNVEVNNFSNGFIGNVILGTFSYTQIRNSFNYNLTKSFIRCIVNSTFGQNFILNDSFDNIFNGQGFEANIVAPTTFTKNRFDGYFSASFIYCGQYFDNNEVSISQSCEMNIFTKKARNNIIRGCTLFNMNIGEFEENNIFFYLASGSTIKEAKSNFIEKFEYLTESVVNYLVDNNFATLSIGGMNNLVLHHSSGSRGRISFSSCSSFYNVKNLGTFELDSGLTAINNFDMQHSFFGESDILSSLATIMANTLSSKRLIVSPNGSKYIEHHDNTNMVYTLVPQV